MGRETRDTSFSLRLVSEEGRRSLVTAQVRAVFAHSLRASTTATNGYTGKFGMMWQSQRQRGMPSSHWAETARQPGAGGETLDLKKDELTAWLNGKVSMKLIAWTFKPWFSVARCFNSVLFFLFSVCMVHPLLLEYLSIFKTEYSCT